MISNLSSFLTSLKLLSPSLWELTLDQLWKRLSYLHRQLSSDWV